ncbi:TPA: YmfQ family protein [Salmonella enterica subsp. enterica serovar Yopougon]
MGMTTYQRVFLQLLPTGLAWNKDSDSTLAKLSGALADSPERDAGSIASVLTERFPDQSTVLLEDWEKWLGLPDCTSAGQTVEERRTAAAEKYRMVGSLNRQFYIDLAARYGFDIEIESFSDGAYATCLDNCRTRLRKNYGRFTSHIIVKNHIDYRNATVLDNCLTPLRVYSGGVLECLFDKYKPAHQVFIYIYQ